MSQRPPVQTPRKTQLATGPEAATGGLPSASLSVAPALRPPGLFILVVDDEPDMLSLLVQLVRLAFPEANLKTAQSGEHALEFLNQDAFHLLVTDFRMPGMDGLELAGRAKAIHPTIKRVMLTAFADSSFGGRAVENGTIDRLFKKPVEPTALISALRAMVVPG